MKRHTAKELAKVLTDLARRTPKKKVKVERSLLGEAAEALDPPDHQITERPHSQSFENPLDPATSTPEDAGIESWWFCLECGELRPAKETGDHPHEAVELVRRSALERLRESAQIALAEEGRIASAAVSRQLAALAQAAIEAALYDKHVNGEKPSDKSAITDGSADGDGLSVLDQLCEECNGRKVIETGECRVAMSGPTCHNPHCPPCRYPETEPCPSCQPDQPGDDDEWQFTSEKTNVEPCPTCGGMIPGKPLPTRGGDAGGKAERCSEDTCVTGGGPGVAPASETSTDQLVERLEKLAKGLRLTNRPTEAKVADEAADALSAASLSVEDRERLERIASGFDERAKREQEPAFYNSMRDTAAFLRGVAAQDAERRAAERKERAFNSLDVIENLEGDVEADLKREAAKRGELAAARVELARTDGSADGAGVSVPDQSCETYEALEVGDWRLFTTQRAAERWLKTLREKLYEGKLEPYRFRVTVTAPPPTSGPGGERPGS